jgi:DNA-binding transcriptional LysR family regulator
MNKIDLSRVDLNLLALFEVVLEERHAGRAAARLNLSPSAVSHGLSRLRRLLHDPLFIRHPRGLAPSERALGLAEPVTELLDKARALIAGAVPFDPATSVRRFVVGAVDGIGSILLPRLMSAVRRDAPQIDISARSIFPIDVAATLDKRIVDVALGPLAMMPTRIAARELYADDFVVAARVGHSILAQPSLDAYCSAGHLLISESGDNRGFVDDALAAIGRRRRVALTVPSFMLGLAVLAETDLVAAMPRRLITQYGAQTGVASAEPPHPFQCRSYRRAYHQGGTCRPRRGVARGADRRGGWELTSRLIGAKGRRWNQAVAAAAFFRSGEGALR